jgi:hypothetical protein
MISDFTLPYYYICMRGASAYETSQSCKESVTLYADLILQNPAHNFQRTDNPTVLLFVSVKRRESPQFFYFFLFGEWKQKTGISTQAS